MKVLGIIVFIGISGAVIQECKEIRANQPISNEPPIDAGLDIAGLDLEKSYDASLDIVEEPACIRRPEKILLVGDSQVRYLSWYLPKTDIKRDNETVFFDSKGGTTILAWNNIFVREISKYPDLDVVIIFLGTNNHNFNFIQPYQNILDEVKRRNLKCIWAGGTNVYGKKWPIINNLIRNAASNTCTFFDTQEDDIELIDTVHPSLAGGTKWLKDIWEVKDSMLPCEKQN